MIKAAKAISYIFHPIFIPLYALPLYFSIDNYQNIIIKHADQSFIYAMYSLMLIIGVLFPLMSLYIMIRTKIISDFNVSERKERLPVFLIILIYYSMAYLMYKSWNESYYHIIDALMSFLAGGILLMLITFIISTRWKISLHSTSISAMAGGFLAFSWSMAPLYKPDQLIFINLILLLLMGFVSTARILLQAHKPLEVFSGMALGFVVEFLVVYHTIYY